MRKLLFAIAVVSTLFVASCNGCGAPNEDPSTGGSGDTTTIVVDTTVTPADTLVN